MESAETPLIDLLEPREGIPPVTDTQAALDAAISALKAGTGPIAVDAERASGFRYGQRAFLVQLRRRNAGTWLIDSEALPQLAPLQAALGEDEWIIHAASQDLTCLREVQLQPPTLFDTELGARIAGLPKVGLGTLTEELLGIHLAKEHSAADWSQRPLPESWLAYAALDVEVLEELRDVLADLLRGQGKLDWALEEFETVRTSEFPAQRSDPWRRTSGIHRIRYRKQLAVVRALWEAREDIAADQDLPPGRILQDAAIIEAAAKLPRSGSQLHEIRGFNNQNARPQTATWVDVIRSASALKESELPPLHLPAQGPPPHRLWKDKNPEAAARLNTARAALTELSAEVDVPVENLLTPEYVRKLAWEPPEDLDPAAVGEALRESGARNWQIQLTAEPLARALASTASSVRRP